MKISAGGKDIHLSQVGSLHTALRHLPVPTKNYYYDESAIANLLSFSRIAEEYHVICNTRVDNAIYVQSKVDGKYLRFKRCKTFNLYYMDISKGKVDGHCYFSLSIKEGQMMFSVLDQKQAKAVWILQEQMWAFLWFRLFSCSGM